MVEGLRLVSEAADFAARRHTGQQRKGRGNEPYVNHLAEVANLLSTASDATDAELVATLVVEVTDDMTLPKQERRHKQVVDAPRKSPEAKLIKIADKISNIR